MTGANMTELLLKKELGANKIPTKLMLELNKNNIDLIRLTKKCALEQFGIKLNSLKSVEDLKSEVKSLYYDNINEWIQEQLRSYLREKSIISTYAKEKRLNTKCFNTLMKDDYFKHLFIELRPYQHHFMYQQTSRGIDIENETFLSPMEMAPTEDNPYINAAWLEVILIGIDPNNKRLECNIGMITGYIADIEMLLQESEGCDTLVGKDEFLSISHIVDEFWDFLNDSYLENKWIEVPSDQALKERSAYMLNHIQLKNEYDSIEYVELILKLIPSAIMDLYKRKLKCIFYTPGETEMEDFTVGNGIAWPEYLDDVEVLLEEQEFTECSQGRFCKWFT